MEYVFTDHGSRFSFDEGVRLIVNLDDSVKKYLSRNESAMLACLLQGAQSREKLMSSIWFDRGVVVTNASYYQLIAQLRKSFDEVGLPKDAIKTIPRFGLELAVRRETAAEHAPVVSAVPNEPLEPVLTQIETATLEALRIRDVEPYATRPIQAIDRALSKGRGGRGIFTFLRGCYRAIFQESPVRS
jgi:DNA-binding winged helix-turn-helix (wHTH) protein